MKRNEIKKLAKKSGLWQIFEEINVVFPYPEIESLVELSMEKERSECIKVCDLEHADPVHYSAITEAKWIGILIANRGKK